MMIKRLTQIVTAKFSLGWEINHKLEVLETEYKQNSEFLPQRVSQQSLSNSYKTSLLIRHEPCKR